MPVNREPAIYPGYVISKLSRNMGERENMDWVVAQGCVMQGTHAWPDEPVEDILTGKMKRELQEREAAEAEGKAESERIAREKAEIKGRSVEDAVKAAARPLTLASEKDGDATIIYLARPAPAVIAFDDTAIDGDFFEADEIDGRRLLRIHLANAEMEYEVVTSEPHGETIRYYATLQQSSAFDGTVREGWRGFNAMQKATIAKKIRGLDKSASMTAAEAEPIIEEWTKNDPVPEDRGSGDGENRIHGDQAGSRIVSGERNENPEGGDPAEKAKQNEKDFVRDGD